MITNPLPPLTLRGRTLLPIVQGGMGVGISAHRLAGAVAREGAIGTIASVDLRRLHPDIMQRLRKCRDPGNIRAPMPRPWTARSARRGQSPAPTASSP